MMELQHITGNDTYEAQWIKKHHKAEYLKTNTIFFMIAITLHGVAIAYMIKAQAPSIKKPPIVMEVAMISMPKAKEPEVMPKSPPIKQIEKPKPVVLPHEIKKTVVIKKVSPVVLAQKPEEKVTIQKAPVFEVPEPAEPVQQTVSHTSPTQTMKNVSENIQTHKFSLSNVECISCPKPRYPTRALRANIQGFVKVEFIVNENGSVDDVSILEAQPENTFEDTVISTIKEHWQFAPKRLNDQPVKQRAIQTFPFKIQ